MGNSYSHVEGELYNLFFKHGTEHTKFRLLILKASNPKYLTLVDIQAQKFKGMLETKHFFLLQKSHDFQAAIIIHCQYVT